MSAATYARVALGALRPRARPAEPPARELRRDGVRADRARLAAYDRVCGFALADALPATYVHVLAFPLGLELMAALDFPFAVLGLVHVANEIEQRRPVDAAESLDLRVRAERLAPHRRGRTIDVVAEARAVGELVWRGRSTYLHREAPAGPAAGGRPAADGPAADEGEPPAPAAVWRVPADTGRRYAAVSGDRNPIHLHALTARAFGQPAAIAHGMWTAARCLATLQGTLPGAFSYAVRFAKPVRLPATVAFASWAQDGVRRVAVHDARRGLPHLSGVVRAT